MLFAYSKRKSAINFQDLAIHFLESCKSENNSVIRQYSKIGISAQTAAKSQALLQLRRKYCEAKNCLNCNIGNQLLKE